MDRLTYRNKNGDVGLVGEKESLTSIEVVDLINNALDKLAHYEELADARRLIELPCAVGDTVYVLREKNIEKAEVFSIKIESEDNHWCFILKCMVTEGYFKNFKRFMYGKTAFLTKEEAERKLKELEK